LETSKLKNIHRWIKQKEKIGTLLLSLLVIIHPLNLYAETFEYQLNNGLKLIVQEDHRAPVVVSQVWYRAGALDEVNGKSGVAHVLEHMMFKGTKAVPAGQFSRLVAAAGGRENAFTAQDNTTYFQQLEKSQLPLSFKLEADRMANLNITDEEFSKEIKVVMEERRWRTEDKPQSKVNEAFNSTIYHVHPYSRPVVGWMNDLENMTADDAREWYKNWYAPNNAIVVVVGDVNAPDVLALAKKYFEPIKPHKLPVRKPQVEPEQKGERSVIVKAPAKLPYVLMGFHAPALKNPDQDKDPYALEILSAILSGNDAARLNQHLVRESQVAIDVDVGYEMLSRGRQSIFVIDGTPSNGKSVEDLKKAILNEIEQIKIKGVTEEELARVKAQVIAADVYQRDSMFYQAMQIGSLETDGYSWKFLKDYPSKLQAVTAQDVQNAANKIFTTDNMTTAILDPQPIDPNDKTPKGKPHVH
jgi:zinc protease